ncbi:protein LIM3 [Momordica charantia]|uniref:Protein LIM3 n=1 Tax=Momordica charantia TaxID=3673 RepID=A0A6J1DFH7_MOMCH|nr:protein LIM3 [Momordica charantia]
MGFLGMKFLSAWVFLLVMTSLGEQSKGETCRFTFFSSLVRLLPCRPSVAPFRAIPPTEACCKAVKTLGQPCLCVLVNGPPIAGVDRDLAMLLPEKCNANFDPCELMK